jgi:23S rRNA (cytidine1920-2'-O)/16S rRNA (cytidine1409-2'-O)-methyltransferase
MARRERLDILVHTSGIAETRQRAQALIRAGKILVNDTVVDKPGTRIPEEAALRLKGAPLKYVGRGGFKLEGALDHFGVDPAGLLCADLGASTGGFTDCLLQRSAARVYAVDVGYGQLAWKLQQDDRVVVMDRTNVRHLEALPEVPQLVVGDLSFISLTLILPAVQRIAPGAECVLLIKPQFEVGRGAVKGGRVRDPAKRAAAIATIAEAAIEQGAHVHGTVASSLPGAKKGNIEELIHLTLPSER